MGKHRLTLSAAVLAITLLAAACSSAIVDDAATPPEPTAVTVPATALPAAEPVEAADRVRTEDCAPVAETRHDPDGEWAQMLSTIELTAATAFLILTDEDGRRYSPGFYPDGIGRSYDYGDVAGYFGGFIRRLDQSSYVGETGSCGWYQTGWFEWDEVLAVADGEAEPRPGRSVGGTISTVDAFERASGGSVCPGLAYGARYSGRNQYLEHERAGVADGTREVGPNESHKKHDGVLSSSDAVKYRTLKTAIYTAGEYSGRAQAFSEVAGSHNFVLACWDLMQMFTFNGGLFRLAHTLLPFRIYKSVTGGCAWIPSLR